MNEPKNKPVSARHVAKAMLPSDEPSLDGQSKAISRRTFCRFLPAFAGITAVGWAMPTISHLVCGAHPTAKSVAAESQRNNRVKFYKNLAPGHIGVKANQQQALEYAVKYGFDSITPQLSEFENKSATEICEWVQMMKEKSVRYGATGLPVEFRKDEERFQQDLVRLPKRAAVLRQMGASRMVTWIPPGHNELTYLQNFEQQKRRFREVAKVLGDNGIRLGLEFVGPRTSRAQYRFPFICTQLDMMELLEAIGEENMGLLLDSWHWYTSQGTVEELLRLSSEDVIHVHVNDAPSGIPVDQQIDNRRKLPLSSGVIDLKGFINALVKIDYDGPVECEPFDQELREMEDSAALQKTIESLNRLWDLITL